MNLETLCCFDNVWKLMPTLLGEDQFVELYAYLCLALSTIIIYYICFSLCSFSD